MLTEDVSPPHVENFVAPQNGNLQRCDPEISSCHKLRPRLPVGLPKLDYTLTKFSLPALENALINALITRFHKCFRYAGVKGIPMNEPAV